MLSGSNGGWEEPEGAVHGHAAEEGTCDFLDDAGADSFFSHLGSHRGSKCTSSVTHMTRATAYPHFLTLCSPTGVVQGPCVIPAKISSGCAAVPFHSSVGFPCLGTSVRNWVLQHQRHTEEMGNKLPNIRKRNSKNTWPPANKHQ